MKKKLLIAVFSICVMCTGCGNEEINDNIVTNSVAQESISDNQVEILEEATAKGESVSENQVQTEPEEEPKEQEINLIMVGDILLHTPVEQSARRDDGSYNYGAIFENLKDEIEGADLAIANQEVIIGGEELGVSGYPAFNAPYAIGDALVDAGFDVICHGTNHAVDKGKKGLVNCMNYWEENHPEIEVLGIHPSSEDQEEIFIWEKDGIKLAILNFTYGTNGIALPSDMPFAVDLLEEEKVVSSIKKAEELADLTIVCPHWGTEYNLGIDSMQKKWTRIFMENGVDLVIGTHPHVIEPLEIIEDETTGQKMVVYYSLGNFVNWTSGTGEGVANRMVGGMAKVRIMKDLGGNIYVDEASILPVVCHVTSGQDGVKVYSLGDYTEELGLENEIRKQDSNFSWEYCVELCEKVWGIW